MSNQAAIREEITNNVVASLKKGVIPWRRPWSMDPNCGFPRNVQSKKLYRGINPLLLEITAMAHGWRSQWWGTYRQWQALGGQVRRGQKGTTVVFWKVRFCVNGDFMDQDDIPAGTDKKEIKKVFLLVPYYVFNVEQVEGEKLNKFRPMSDEDLAKAVPNFEPADKAIKATGAVIKHGGNSAVYHPGGYPKDWIGMPHRRQFSNVVDYYDTLGHELVHWTARRVNRETGTEKARYAFEELVAEMGACFFNSAVGIPQGTDMKNHEAYIASWLKHMEDDPKWIIRASSQASKAVDFLMHFSNPKEYPLKGAPEPEKNEDMPDNGVAEPKELAVA